MGITEVYFDYTRSVDKSIKILMAYSLTLNTTFNEFLRNFDKEVKTVEIERFKEKFSYIDSVGEEHTRGHGYADRRIEDFRKYCTIEDLEALSYVGLEDVIVLIEEFFPKAIDRLQRGEILKKFPNIDEALLLSFHYGQPANMRKVRVESFIRSTYEILKAYKESNP